MAFSGEKLKQIRIQRGLSQRDMPVAHDTVSAIESGRRNPHPSTLRKLAAALDVEVSDFFEEQSVPLGEAPVAPGAEGVPLWQQLLQTWLLEQPAVNTTYLAMQNSEGREVVGGMSREELRELLDDLDTEKRAIAHAFEEELGYPVGARKDPPTELHKALKRGWHSYGGWLLEVGKRRRQLAEQRQAEESSGEARLVASF